MKPLNLYCKNILLFFFWLLCSQIATAQIKADFTTKTVEGCAPFLATFTNTSTPLTATTQFEWSFGNGNTSFEKDAATIYTLPGTYSVRLTVRENGQGVSKEVKLVVHPSPSVNFKADTMKGCAPLDVRFEIEPAAGGNTAGYSYFWDFGDGTVQEITGTTSIQHQYTFGQYNAVSLVATNQWGCQTKIRKDSLVDVSNSPTAAFSSKDSILCSQFTTIEFSNNSIDTGTVSYTWDFGDGNKSNQKNPIHTYLGKGQYDITLSAVNAAGCSSSIKKVNYINFSTFTPSIRLPDATCSTKDILIQNTTSPVPANASWLIEGYGSGIESNAALARYVFSDTGNYTLRLINEYSPFCSDTIYHPIHISPLPEIGTLSVKEESTCEQDIKYIIGDTSSHTTAWEWRFYNFENEVIGTNRSLEFTSRYGFTINLTATTAEGCKTQVSQYIHYEAPAKIKTTKLNSNVPDGLNGCTDSRFQFDLETKLDVVSYRWRIGETFDTVITEASPQLTFIKPGINYIAVDFETRDGCKSTLVHPGTIEIDYPPQYSIKLLSDTELCGNTPFYIEGTALNNVSTFIYDFGDGHWRLGHPDPVTRKFTYGYEYKQEGTYTISVWVGNGMCWDTAYLNTTTVKVKPPIANIERTVNQCEGDRGVMTFFDSYEKTGNWSWDFGDGTSLSYTNHRPTIQHQYKKSGNYTAKLTFSDGSCTITDTIDFRILINQQPRLNASTLESCSNSENSIDFNIDNLDPNFLGDPTRFEYWSYGLFYEDGESIPIINTYGTKFTVRTTDLRKGTYLVRAVTISGEFGCLDTTQSLLLTIKGPLPHPYFTLPSCDAETIQIRDSSKQFNGVPIRNWEWTFPDGLIVSSSKSESFNFQHNQQINYSQFFKLKLTDAEGCETTKELEIPARFNVVAKFSILPQELYTGTTAQFQNNSEFPVNKEVDYTWKINGQVYSTEENPSYSFDNPGTYVIQLIASFKDQSCADTAQQIIYVKNQNAVFDMAAGFIKNSGCPPVVINFNAKIEGQPTISWDFGDGAISLNNLSPSHSYDAPGKYFIRMKASFPNGQLIEGIDSVEVKGMAAADLQADNWSGCIAQQVELKTTGEGLIYAWDFGDGSVLTNNSKTALHAYRTSGIFKPTLLVIDAAGCRQLAETPNRIIIDSLAISLNEYPDRFCENNAIQLTPTITSVAEKAGYALSFNWDLGTTSTNQFSSDRIPVINYLSTGIKNIQFTVRSPLGCQQTITKSITIDKLVSGTIVAPDKVCAGELIQLETSAQTTGLTWNWNLGNGQTSRKQNPDPMNYPAGSYLIQLYTINQSCLHFAEKTITVSPLPDLQVSPPGITLCEGESIRVQATGATDYSWSPVTGIDQPNDANPLFTPAQSGIYKVTGTSPDGCSIEKQVSFTVIPDYDLSISSDTGICLGASVPINVTGASIYQWIGTVTGLSSVSSSSPVARPDQTTRYTVRSEAPAGCFVKETGITINVYPLPQVQLGPDITTYPGSQLTLNPTASPDVIQWSWNPANDLSCNDCPNPVTRPLKDITYQVKVTNGDGCTATDEIKLIIGCNEDKIAIPNAFTPNSDGKNDRFQLIAPGVAEIESWQIYNRFGQLVYEVKNGSLGAGSTGWDGRYKGLPQPAGTYVYYVQLRCSNNQRIIRKGTVVLIY